MVVELDTEIFDDGYPGDDTVEHSDFADRSEMTLGKKNRVVFFRIHVDSPSAQTMIPDLSTARCRSREMILGDQERTRIAVSSAYSAIFVLSGFGMSAVKIAYRVGESTEPCGTPAWISRWVERTCPIFAWKTRRLRN
jgi:hypothetical protein